MSVSIVIVWLVVGTGVAGKFVGTAGSRYVNSVSVRILATLVEILYSGEDTPFILIGVPLLNPCAVEVVTVTTLPAVLPSPDLISDIEIGSEANAPTISNSGLWALNPSGLSGYFSSISLVDAMLNAFDNLL